MVLAQKLREKVVQLMPSSVLVVRVGGVAARVHKGSRSVPVLLLHGNSSCMLAFEDMWTDLAAQGYTLLAFDLPGHGQSEDASDPHSTYTLPGYAEVVSSVLDAASCTEAIAVGWSLGGHVAMEAMVRDPRVRAAMVIGSPPGRPSQVVFETAFSRDPTTQLAGKEIFSGTDASDYACAMLGTNTPPPHLLKMASRTDGRARKRLVESVLQEVGLDPAEGYSIERPLAVVVGAEDPFLQSEYFASLDHNRFWMGKVHVLAGEGHAPHIKPSDQFRKLLENFLADTAQ